MSRYIRTSKNMRAFNALSYINNSEKQTPFLMLSSAKKDKAGNIFYFDNVNDNIKFEIIKDVKNTTVGGVSKPRRILYSPSRVKIVYSVPDPTEGYELTVSGKYYNFLKQGTTNDDGSELIEKDNILLQNRFNNDDQKYYYLYISYIVDKADFISKYGYVDLQSGDRVYCGYQADTVSLVNLFTDNGLTASLFSNTDFLTAVGDDFTKGLVLEDLLNLEILPLQVETNDFEYKIDFNEYVDIYNNVPYVLNNSGLPFDASTGQTNPYNITEESVQMNFILEL